jgi:hypothetical protein
MRDDKRGRADHAPFRPIGNIIPLTPLAKSIKSGRYTSDFT